MSQTLDFPDKDVANAIRRKAVELYPDPADDGALKASIRGGSSENAMLFLVAGVDQHKRKFPNFGSELLLQTVLAIVKTGECTIEFLNKITEGCIQFGYRIQPDKELIKIIYKTFGDRLNSGDVAFMIAYWRTQIPNQCPRIKLSVNQAE
ncbi:unnamed protein product [Bemisia tabaci]|uniref:Uncharacterized protein n=1 Tax=Bemisia tabaci TaxID=7038 RepID=A0A9P0A310_BEMTA|nr:unnamed protein product [Bemisia tabaci]